MLLTLIIPALSNDKYRLTGRRYNKKLPGLAVKAAVCKHTEKSFNYALFRSELMANPCTDELCRCFYLCSYVELKHVSPRRQAVCYILAKFNLLPLQFAR